MMQHVGGCCGKPAPTPPGLLRNQPHSFCPKHQPAGTCRTGIIQPGQHSGRLRIRPEHPGHGHYGKTVFEHRRHHTAACRCPLQPTHRPTMMNRSANFAMPVRRDNATLPINLGKPVHERLWDTESRGKVKAFGGVNSALQTNMHLFNSAKELWRSAGRSWPGSPRRSLGPCTCRHWTGRKDDATTIGPHRPDPSRPEPPRACG